MLLVTEEVFEDWKQHPVTKRLFKLLDSEREEMKEGLVYDTYSNPEDVKGRCRAIGILLNITYEEVVDGK